MWPARLAFLSVVLLCGGAPALALDHSPHWSSDGSLTYSLINQSDLDAGAIDNLNYSDPDYPYRYCWWGNVLAVSPILGLGPYQLAFDGLTQGPHDRQNEDLFLSESSFNAFLQPTTLAYLSFADAGAYFYPPLPALGQGLLRVGQWWQPVPPQAFLFRYLHFDNQLWDEWTGRTIRDGDDTRKLIVLVHGWNPTGDHDGFAGPEFDALTDNLGVYRTASGDCGWKLVKYHWEADADTGPGGLLHPDTVVNATEAAEIAFEHGIHLGELLVEQCPGLQKVQFIAHSAGGWVARAAARYLLVRDPAAVVQVTLLDPFIPGSVGNLAVPSSWYLPSTRLDSRLMASLASVPGKIWALENYYSDDWGTFNALGGTQDSFGSPWTDQRVDVYGGYSSHMGPVEWYSDTVAASGSGIDSANINPFWDSLAIMGWSQSLFFEEPVIDAEPPTAVVASVGESVRIAARAHVRGGALVGPGWKQASLTYRWRKDGTPLAEGLQASGAIVSGAETAALSLANVTAADQGAYTVVIANGSDGTTSRPAQLTVNSPSSVALPVFYPAPGEFTLGVEVGITGPPSAQIYYTTDGSFPTAITSERYSGPISLTETTHLRAIAVSGTVQSLLASGTYTIASSGTSPQITGVSSGAGVPGSSAEQWIDIEGSGFMPNFIALLFDLTTHDAYPAVIDPSKLQFVSANEVKVDFSLGASTADWTVMITNPNGASSDPFTFHVVAAGAPVTAAPPTFNPAQGPYAGPIAVQISDSTPGAVIRYTTDGTDPGPDSTVYSGPIPVAGSISFKARAFLYGSAPSGVVPAAYAIAAPSTGSLTVSIGPAEAAGAQWRVNGGAWQANGATLTGVSIGPVTVDFSPMSGWAAPAPTLLSIGAGQSATYSATYARANHPPNVAGVISPGNGNGSVQRAGLTLFWHGGDPDPGDVVEYAVLLGTVPNPGPIIGYGTVTGDPGSYGLPFTLEAGTTYYWEIVARDNHGAISKSPVWHFTTAYSAPDLAISDVTVSGTPAPGATVTVSAKVTNVGDFVSDGIAYVRLYLSQTAGAKAIPLTGSDKFLPPSSLFVQPLDPGQAVTVSAPVTLNGLPGGTSYIDAWVDSGQPSAYNERNLANNIASAPISYADVTPPKITRLELQYPSGFYTGQPNGIIYAATDDVAVATVDFSYSSDNGANWTTVEQGYVPPTPTQYGLTYAWAPPQDLPLTTTYLIRLVAHDPSGNTDTQTAGPYALRDGSLPRVTLVSPTGGEVWDMGSTHTISWTISSSKPIRYAAVWIVDGKEDIDSLPVVTNPAISSVQWTLANPLPVLSGQVLIEVEDADGFMARAESGSITFHDPSSPPPPPWSSPATVSSSGETGKPRLVTGADGVAYVVFGWSHDNTAHTVSFRYSKRANGSWSEPQTATLDSSTVDALYAGSYQVGDFDAAVDSQGHLHLVWASDFNTAQVTDENNDDVFYAETDGSQWSTPLDLSSAITAGTAQTSLSWSPKASLPQAQVGAASAVANGKLYVLGGNPVNTTFIYDPSNNSWSRGADIPPSGVIDGGAAAVGDAIYALSGLDSSLKIYDTVANTWSLGPSVPVSGQGPSVVALNGKVYVIGGGTSANQLYDPATRSWRELSPMPANRSFAAAAALNGKIYVFGGAYDGGYDPVEAYNPSTDSWTSIAAWDDVSWPRVEAALALTFNGKIYLLGGRSIQDGSDSSAVFEFDPNIPTFRTMASMQAAHGWAAGGLIGSTVYICGGYNSLGVATSILEAGALSSESAGTQSSWPRIALDSNDEAYMVWSDGAHLNDDGSVTGIQRVYYATKSPGQAAAAPQPVAGSDSSIWPAAAVDSSDKLNIAYIAYDGSGLRHLYWQSLAGSGWSAPVVIASPQTGSYFQTPALAAGANRHLHVVWQAYDSTQKLNRIQYSYFDGLAWSQSELVDASATVDPDPRVVLDRQDQPHVLFVDTPSSTGELLHSCRVKDRWSAPVQVNLNSQSASDPAIDEAYSSSDDTLYVAWASPVGLMANAMTNASGAVAQTAVAVASPQDGLVASAGATLQIQWSLASGDTAWTIDLDYSTNDWATALPIAGDLSNSGAYGWTVPDLGAYRAQVRVTAKDAAGDQLTGFSGYFHTQSISPPTIRIDAPAGGGDLTAGDQVTISWAAAASAGLTNVVLDYSVDDGASWLSITNGAEASTSCLWTVPGTPTSELLLRATAWDASGLAASVTNTPPLAISLADTPPGAPSQPLPAPGTESLATSGTSLQWSDFDPDGDALTYTLHFGVASSPPAVGTTAQSQYSLPDLQAAATYYWQVDASDGKTTVSSPVWSFTTEPAPQPPTIALPGQLDPGMVAVAYAATFVATGGTPPYSWAISPVNQPSGLTLDAVGGTLTGTPASAETNRITVTVTDANGLTSARDFQMAIVPAPTRLVELTGDLSFGSLPVGNSATKRLTITSAGTAPLTVTGVTYPAGFTGDWNSGVISPGASQPVTVTFTPTAATNFGGAVVVASDEEGGNGMLALSGVGTAPAVCPADTNASFRIVISEVTAYGAAWKRGDNWRNPPNPIPISYVTRVGYLWKNGECYGYDQSQDPPLCWVLQPCPSMAGGPGAQAASVGSGAGDMEDDGAGSSSVVRSVAGVTVSLQASPDQSVSVYALEESLLAGLTPYDITEGGTWDATNRKVKWGPFFDNAARTLSYSVSGVAGVYRLSGVGSYDGISLGTIGAATIDLASALRLSGLGIGLSGQGLTFTFSTEVGREYYIEFTDNLTQGQWQVVAGPLAGTGQPIQWVDDGSKTGGVPPASGPRFYRVRSSPRGDRPDKRKGAGPAGETAIRKYPARV